ncbi:MAG TPA: CDP-diacylglycerol--glycerol-3-phosphate 3-phosphatidyltransferase [Synergistaceae bacterium]|jgi:CDP-diacylglycerol--glycerol-3-phosphate 3-phosphatidyltransferase|nr:MAG: CDP-diacylglycerol/glycerol-3-phosphate3-phospha tidyltransferase [Synergistales bacterium 53_16]KUL00642.1 MAG: CDP-diacylglycerol/glycerol-3-phosphate3-phospha tidyltransferase [Synergistales bacterium 54_9]MDK2845724.1 CDP-diacylglycerol---glycerol-3-phosphate 3-phosphatidyltransferase [Synergistales bacterium]HAA47560.1 CDP-diacylglycerol--glycerol-3-phosphate 3-phosphatidyltransferase [Synergistaceae bacterium]MDN5335372.1 CDP-diacylglycerol---glycerol-3-phosphate 3-phosphatidyltra
MTALNLPNMLSLSRVFLAPLVMVFLTLRAQFGSFLGLPFGDLLAGVVFIIAAATDTVDGYVARKHGMVTNFGKLVDPLADKILVTAALVSLVQLQRLPAWIVVVIVSREFFVTGLRMVAISEGEVIPASSLGKVKTVVQITAILLVIFNLPGGLLAMWVAMLVTVASGTDYFLKSKNLFVERKVSGKDGSR